MYTSCTGERSKLYFWVKSCLVWNWISITIFPIISILIVIPFPEVSGVTHHNHMAEMAEGESYCYNDPSCDEQTWSGMCNTGINQSPINIQRNSFHARFAKPTTFHLNYKYAAETAYKFYGQNIGHTVHFALTSNASDLTSDLVISGGELNGKYKFAELHFHWAQRDYEGGSEHEINGKRYQLEMHLVHHKKMYRNVADALESNDREALAVMAVLYKVGQIPNPDLSPIILALERLQEPGNVMEFNSPPLRILDLYPKKLEFARYLGSVTTPTCDETVVWTVFHRPEVISENQLQAFRRLTNEEGESGSNFRTVKPLNNRIVEFYRVKGFVDRSNNPIHATIDFGSSIIQMIYSLGRGMLRMLRMPMPYLLYIFWPSG